MKNQLGPRRKLDLQDADDDEYRWILEGNPRGEGKITKAWEILKSAVYEKGPECLMKGLSRFKVISFTCQSFDDPQQIFESLNTTGIPLTEGEKVKNWLLMKLDPETQDRLYQDHWCGLEKSLDAVQEPKRIDEFFRDFLRWKTGETYGIRQTYANLRRWWYKSQGSGSRGSLCQEFARLAGLYGKITGANDKHGSKRVNKILQHLRDLRIDVHRPFTLRMLNDASKSDVSGVNEEELIQALSALSTWLTRFWIAGKSLAGLNNEFARFAHHKDGQYIRSYADYWIERIENLRRTRIAVPNEEEIIEGIRKRKAYGSKATDAAKAILWAMNSQLGNAASPRIEDLSIEHIMPQKLSAEWKKYLGEDADELYGDYVNSLANLTLIGKEYNSEISNQIYEEKRKRYRNSSVMLTRKLPESYADWRKDDMEARVRGLAGLVLECWPWENVSRAVARWRINQGDWQKEQTYRAVLPKLVAGLLDLGHLENAARLSGDRISRDLQPANLRLKDPTRYEQIPGYHEYKIYVSLTFNEIIRRCRELGERCGVVVEVEQER